MGDTTIFLQKLLETTAGIPFSCIPFTKEALQDFLHRTANRTFDSFLTENASLWHHLHQIPPQDNTIDEYSSLGGITLLMYVNRQAQILYILGPVLTQPFNWDETLQNARQHQIPSQVAAGIAQFAGSLPVVASHILYRTADLVFGYLTDKEQPMNIVQNNLLPSQKSFFMQPVGSGGDIVQMRQVEMRYEYSAALTDAIKQGNLPLALYMIGRYDPEKQTSIRNKNPLRNAQNYCIVLNTQLRHALEESGIHPYWVDKLSNEIGLEIEQLKTTAQLPRFMEQIIRRYCRLVQEHTYPKLKPLTNLAVTYIKEHLADNLTVKDTAKALTVNANYLSTLFHQQLGMTFIDFVNRERTNQAAALLKHTNLQIQQIAATVGYNNTSYFAKQFLKFQGATPSQYRNAET